MKSFFHVSLKGDPNSTLHRNLETKRLLTPLLSKKNLDPVYQLHLRTPSVCAVFFPVPDTAAAVLSRGLLIARWRHGSGFNRDQP